MAERKLYPSEKQDRLIVRFPDGMRDRIAALAKANKRSMNAEVISMIEASQAPSRKPVPVVDENTTEVGELKESMKELKVEIAEFRATLTKFADALVPNFAAQAAIGQINENLSQVLERVNALAASPVTRLPSKNT